MARYIDADKCLDEMLDEMVGTGYQSRAMGVIKYAPTADVVEVKHGKWQFVNQATNYLEPPTGDMCKCSVCEYEIDVSEAHFKYCPNCGAKMDGGAE